MYLNAVEANKRGINHSNYVCVYITAIYITNYSLLYVIINSI